jgi:hypothetical protein
MSRPHIMPLLAPGPAGRGLGQQPARPTARAGRAAARAAKAAAAQQAGEQVICVGVRVPLDGCDGTLADAVLRRVLHCGRPVGTVILDLGTATAIDPGASTAIVGLHHRLAALGTRLRLAAGLRGVAACLADDGIREQLGRDRVHPSFRSAVLATYAALPGPGLVMGRVKTALETVAEALASEAGEPAAIRELAAPALMRLHPLRVERGPRARRWTVVRPDHTAEGRTSCLT